MSAPTAPGVYVREIPSGSRAVVGVATSRTAFIGPALRGPVDEPVRVTSWSEYEGRFGGLWGRSVASQAVRHFFLNGGADALVVRVANADAMVLRATDAVAAEAGFDRVTVTVSGVAGAAFTLAAQARNAAGTVLKNGAGKDYAVSVDVDPAADPVAAIDGAQVDGVGVVQVVGAPLTGAPPEGTWSTRPGPGGGHVLTLGARATGASAELPFGLLLRTAAEVAALDGFDRLRATVADSGGGTFDLTLAAVDENGAVLTKDTERYEVELPGLTPAGAAAAITAARTTTVPPIPLAAPSGRAPTRVPVNGVTTGTAEVVVPVATLRLRAADPGAWGDRLRARIDTRDADAGAFTLTVEELDAAGAVLAAEVFYGARTEPDAPRALGRLLEQQSRLVRLEQGATPVFDGDGAVITLTGGADGGDPRITQDVQGSAARRTGIHALVEADIVSLLCIPLASWSEDDAGHTAMWAEAAAFCERHRAFLLVDPPAEWATPAAAVTGAQSFAPRSDNAALYYPRVRVSDPLREGRAAEFPPCGVVAGVMARTDGERGIWKAPAGIDAALRGVPELATRLADAQHGELNSLGVNCLRSFPVYGRVVWGARTLNGADVQPVDGRYVPVRRLALYLEESLLRGSRWAVFEPNCPELWSQLRLSVGGFLHQLFRQGAFAGTSAAQAYFVKCDAETTTPSDRDRGIVNVMVGFAPLRPAEFVVIRLQQLASQAGQ